MSDLSLRHSFFFNDTATTEIYTLSLHDALPIWMWVRVPPLQPDRAVRCMAHGRTYNPRIPRLGDRKSTRLNSSHMSISYAVFCLKKKRKTITSIAIKKTNNVKT